MHWQQPQASTTQGMQPETTARRQTNDGTLIFLYVPTKPAFAGLQLKLSIFCNMRPIKFYYCMSIQTKRDIIGSLQPFYLAAWGKHFDQNLGKGLMDAIPVARSDSSRLCSAWQEQSTWSSRSHCAPAARSLCCKTAISLEICKMTAPNFDFNFDRLLNHT